MRLPPFDIERPLNLRAALDVLRELGDEAQPYMGGTELLLVMKMGLANPETLVECKRVPELFGCDFSDEREWWIGAGTTHRRLELDEQLAARIPAFVAMARAIANVRVRNVGTIGGNLCFAEPHSDPATLLMALGARAVLASPAGLRDVPLEDFVLGPLTTALQPPELLVRVAFGAVRGADAVHFRRLAFRERPIVNVALVRRNDGHRLVVGAVGGRPARMYEAEGLLDSGAAPRLVAQAAERETVPLEDLEGSVDYKRHLVGVLTERVVREAIGE